MRIGVLAYPGCFASEVFGVPDLLTMAGHVAAGLGSEAPAVEVVIISPRRRVTVAGGAVLEVAPSAPVELLVVPGFEFGPDTDLDARFAAWGPELAEIAAHAARGATIVSVCVGAFLLAEAGLLTGRTATTSWLFADLLARRYPEVAVCPQELVVVDGAVTTAAAFSAMYDVALSLIRARDGEVVARRTARVALVDDARSSQTPFVDPDMVPRAGNAFSRDVRRLLEADVAAPYDLRRLADALHVSTRTLLRRFRQETGRTPLSSLHAGRVRRARHLLETTDRTVAAIAADVGYADPGAFAAIFTRETGRGPRDYRVAFRRTPSGATVTGASGASAAPSRRPPSSPDASAGLLGEVRRPRGGAGR